MDNEKKTPAGTGLKERFQGEDGNGGGWVRQIRAEPGLLSFPQTKRESAMSGMTGLEGHSRNQLLE